eukprot:CAMPEP_0202865864 /NCGR_PEP_ID=MMETSP1391-20130828/6582_1 /ASSEMBLY_ACC=CAM_ASM_000867 /TAXON_ID=1034604 /ORGANISM="Chlamydomonas leiostraca, Strain SAG 11-49" /LENGTH=309 /DNA_ID=CAMNT_0049545747 /DNA_START=132 /DNA_END=1061 /DNA_ORIENTATION=+
MAAPDNEIAEQVYKGIEDEGFEGPAVDTLLHLVRTEAGAGSELLGDVLVYLVQKEHPDWAAEICRMAWASHKGQPPDFTAVCTALAYVVDMSQLQAAVKVCHFILQMKENTQGAYYFDCYDISFVLGNMVEGGMPSQAGAILYSIYCDDSSQGQMYQELVPYVLGTLIDYGKVSWATELSKQLMYADGEAAIDYGVVGWCMAQMVYNGRSDWAACICDAIRAQKTTWYNQGALLAAIESWGGPSASQTVANFMLGPKGDSPTKGGAPAPAGPMHAGPRPGGSPGKPGAANGATTLHFNAAPFMPGGVGK